MKPTYWLLQWINPRTNARESATYYQRAAARGAVIMRNAQGMRDVQLIPQWGNPK